VLLVVANRISDHSAFGRAQPFGHAVKQCIKFRGGFYGDCFHNTVIGNTFLSISVWLLAGKSLNGI
jgi:hypothetical protein